jgi:hypothetical protein
LHFPRLDLTLLLFLVCRPDPDSDEASKRARVSDTSSSSSSSSSASHHSNLIEALLNHECYVLRDIFEYVGDLASFISLKQVSRLVYQTLATRTAVPLPRLFIVKYIDAKQPLVDEAKLSASIFRSPLPALASDFKLDAIHLLIDSVGKKFIDPSQAVSVFTCFDRSRPKRTLDPSITLDPYSVPLSSSNPVVFLSSVANTTREFHHFALQSLESAYGAFLMPKSCPWLESLSLINFHPEMDPIIALSETNFSSKLTTLTLSSNTFVGFVGYHAIPPSVVHLSIMSSAQAPGIGTNFLDRATRALFGVKNVRIVINPDWNMLFRRMFQRSYELESESTYTPTVTRLMLAYNVVGACSNSVAHVIIPSSTRVLAVYRPWSSTDANISQPTRTPLDCILINRGLRYLHMSMHADFDKAAFWQTGLCTIALSELQCISYEPRRSLYDKPMVIHCDDQIQEATNDAHLEQRVYYFATNDFSHDKKAMAAPQREELDWCRTSVHDSLVQSFPQMTREDLQVVVPPYDDVSLFDSE